MLNLFLKLIFEKADIFTEKTFFKNTPLEEITNKVQYIL